MLFRSSINKFALPGQRIRCVDIFKAPVEINDGDMVVVTRTRSVEMRETTAKRVRRRDGKFELWPESTDPKWREPLVITPGGADQDDEILITAKVLYAYQAP